MLTSILVEIFENRAFLPIFSVLILDDKGVAISAKLRPHLLKICGHTVTMGLLCSLYMYIISIVVFFV